jgi:hypothetical protein
MDGIAIKRKHGEYTALLFTCMPASARSRTVGERRPHEDTVITGAPVPLDDESDAQSWFNGLMK